MALIVQNQDKYKKEYVWDVHVQRLVFLFRLSKYTYKLYFFIPGDDWWDFSIDKKHFQFSSWDHLISEQGKAKLCNKMIETWKLEIPKANWNVKLKSPWMEHGFLSQNKLY